MIVRNPCPGVTFPAPSAAIDEYLFIRTAFAPGDTLVNSAGKELTLVGVRVYVENGNLRKQWTDTFAQRFQEEDLIAQTVKIHRKIPVNNG